MQSRRHKIQRKESTSFFLILFLLFAVSSSAFSKANGAANALESQIRTWLLEEKLDTGALTIQVNDSRLQIPACGEDFILNFTPQHKDLPIRTIKASCPKAGWSRLIRIRANKQRNARERDIKEIEKESVFVTVGPIKQYEKITRDKLTELSFAKNKIPSNAVNLAASLNNLYARRTLRTSQTLTDSDVIRPQKVIIMNTSLPAQSLIESDDLSVTYRIRDLPHDAIKSLEGLSNLATNRLLHAGDILRKRDLTKAKLIKRGDLVMVEAKSNNFQILNEAIAFQDGYFGDQIKLTTADTKRQINARVIGKGKVRTLSKHWISK